MSTATERPPVTIRAIPASRVHVMRGTAAGFGSEFLAPVVGPLFDRLADRLIASGRRPAPPAVAWYVPLEDGECRVHVSFVAPAGSPLGSVADQDFDVVELPAVSSAAVAVHRGHPYGLGEAWPRLLDAAARHGWVPCGPARESYQSSVMVPLEEWVTELQLPVTRG